MSLGKYNLDIDGERVSTESGFIEMMSRIDERDQSMAATQVIDMRTIGKTVEWSGHGARYRLERVR